MITKKTVFILGAGSSLNYHYPSGEQLFQNAKNILPLLQEEYTPEGFASIEIEEIKDISEQFIKELSFVRGQTIDTFINYHPFFDRIGRISIASQILSVEPEYRPDGIYDDDWQSLLFRKMLDGINISDGIEALKYNNVSFITFNYDRSFEYSLYTYMNSMFREMPKYEKSRIAQSLSSFIPTHIYGQVGLLGWEYPIKDHDKVIHFGAAKTSLLQYSMKASKYLTIMRDHRMNEEVIREAQDRIYKADVICFLGFGYDKYNLSILGVKPLLQGKRVIGTRIGKSDIAFEEIRNSLSIDSSVDFLNIDSTKRCHDIILDYIF
jgi:hypothetical protein